MLILDTLRKYYSGVTVHHSAQTCLELILKPGSYFGGTLFFLILRTELLRQLGQVRSWIGAVGEKGAMYS
ncbi:hypothetical protein ACFL27_27780 [candidate division CSSED10-310 bacterium]|uniref:Uncharacterized protein n=1 Tax=candidate division CSSED10-310 bacterium TaxID=2855610 RepID=A0ABV6Z6D1_UNCC1